MLRACRCQSLASRLVNGRHIATIRLTETPETRPKPNERQIPQDRHLPRPVPSRCRKPAAGARPRHGAAGPSRSAQLSRGLGRRAPLGGLRDHRLPRDVHRRRRRAHAPHPPRHRCRLAALPQPLHGGRPPDAARLHDARTGHVRRRAGLARLRRRQDGARGQGPAAQARRIARRHHGADAGPHGHQEDRLVRPERGAAAAQELLAADDGDGGRLLALADRRLVGRQARHRHAVDRRHVGRLR